MKTRAKSNDVLSTHRLKWYLIEIFLVSILAPTFVQDYIYLPLSHPLKLEVFSSTPPEVAFQEVLRSINSRRSPSPVPFPQKEKKISSQVILLNSLSPSLSGDRGSTLLKKVRYREIKGPTLSMKVPPSASPLFPSPSSPQMAPPVSSRILASTLPVVLRSEENPSLMRNTRSIPETGGTESTWLRGRLYLQGEGLGSGRRLEVFRSENGIFVERGTVSLKDAATFELRTANPNKGTLVARLVDEESGHLIAIGTQRLRESLDLKKTPFGITLQNPSFSFRGSTSPFSSSRLLSSSSTSIPFPSARGLKSSSSSSRSKEFTEGALALNQNIQEVAFSALPQMNRGGKGGKEKGRETGIHRGFEYLSELLSPRKEGPNAFRLENVWPGSWSLVRTKGPSQYPSIHWIRAGEEEEVPIFSEKTIGSLLDLGRKYRSPFFELEQTNAVVMGQVTWDGASLSRARVVWDGDPLLKPLYFNREMKPDPSLSTTSENGYFAFIDLPPGFQSFRVIQGGGSLQLAHGNIEVDIDHLSFVRLQASSRKNRVQVLVFDAFTGEPRVSDVKIQSEPQSFQVEGDRLITIPDISRQSLAQCHPMGEFNENYYVKETSYVYSDDGEALWLPLIPATWLKEMGSKAMGPGSGNNLWEDKVKSLSLPSVAKAEWGTVVGFVPNENFEVLRGGGGLWGREGEAPSTSTSSIPVVYFNYKGQTVEKGLAGGGFILFHVPQGTQSIGILKASKAFVQVVPVENLSVNVLEFL